MSSPVRRGKPKSAGLGNKPASSKKKGRRQRSKQIRRAAKLSLSQWRVTMSRLKLPDKIKVGPITLSVVLTSDMPVGDNGLPLLGRYDGVRSRILIYSAADYQVQVGTLMHEMFHAIADESGLGYDKNPVNIDDEGFIQTLSAYFHQVLQDNDFSFVRDKESKDENSN